MGLSFGSVGCEVSIFRMVAFERATMANFVARLILERMTGRLH